MRILKIEIEEFGKLRDLLLLPSAGINLICGPNESGKSTLLAFLRFAFYGFPRKSGADGEEREKRLSWQGHRAAGKLFLQTDGGEYCITRAVTRQGSAMRESFSETLSVKALATGEELSLGDLSPGEYFLGIPAVLYDSTLCMRQSDAARVSDPCVSDAVSELMFAGVSGVGADIALDKLRAARRELQHQKGRGGRIAELEDRIVAEEEELRRAERDAADIAALRAGVAEGEKAAARCRRELAAADAAFEQLAIGQTLALFDRAHAASADCAQKKARYDEACSAHAPLLQATQAMAKAKEELILYRSAMQTADAALPELERMRAVRQDEELLIANEVIREKGGAQEVLADFKRAQISRRTSSRTAWTFLLITLIFATVIGVILKGWLLPLFPGLAFFTYRHPVCMVCVCVAGVCFLLSLLFFWRAARRKKRVRAWLKRLHVKEPKLFRTYLEQCTAEAVSAEAHRARLQEREEAYAKQRGEAERILSGVRADLQAVGISLPEQVGEIDRVLTELAQKGQAAHNEIADLKLEYERAAAGFEALSRSLAGQNEVALRAKFRATEVPLDEAEIRRRRDALRVETERCERELGEAKREESARTATAKKPAHAQAALARDREELTAARRRLAALELAISSLEEATRTLREGLLPQICAAASTRLQSLTDGAYQRLYAGTDLSVTLDSPRGPLPLSHFSAGCRDAAHLSLRLGLLDTLSKTPLPLLFDEALARLDDGRARALLTLLCRYAAAGGQVWLFTCHTREASFLAGEEFRHFELP